LKDEIENISEIKKVDILGVDDKEVEIAVDVFKMNAAQVSFDDIQNAVKYENMTLSGGNLVSQGSRNNIRIVGEISNPEQLNNIIVKSFGGTVYLKDIAVVSFKEKEKTTYARESGQEVVMLNIKKRSGQNMISALDQVKEVVKKAQETVLPKDLDLKMTNDQSHRVEHQVNELSNHIIFGIVLVMIVLMFTMGLRNSLFVGAAIPLSMLMAFAILSAFGFTLNTMVLFGLVMGLGLLVDDGIVVVDNVFANMRKGMGRIEASKIGIGEIAWPVISSTATTLAAFIPLALWPGTVGKFMVYFPITLSCVLGASLFVAMIINAAMTGGFMDIEDRNISKTALKKYSIIFLSAGLLFAVPGYLSDTVWMRAIGHLLLISLGLMWLYHIKLFQWTQDFQHSFFPKLEAKYQVFLGKILNGKRATIALISIIGLLFFSVVLMNIFPRDVFFFPNNIPKQIIAYIEYPQGTDIEKTNTATLFVEKQVIAIMSKYVENNENYLAESIVSQVGMGAGNPNVDAGNQSETPFKGKVTINFSEFKFRRGVDTNEVLEDIRGKVKNIAGAKITVEKDAAGPPSGYPVSLQMSGTNYDQMLSEAQKVINFINAKNIPGIEKLNVDVNKESPELEMKIDRVNAGSLGTSTGQVGFTMRRAIYGQQISTYKEGKDDYDIVMRLQSDQRKSESVLFNQPVTFRNQNNGQIMQIPISALATTDKKYVFNQIKRRNSKRVMTIYSNVLEGFTGDGITKQIEAALKNENYKMAGDITYSFSGEQEQQKKDSSFLFGALLLALASITIIIVLQFNSISKTMVIMFTVLLSFSGVFYGYVFAGMDFVILMTMMGIIALSGIVVKNGIVLMDFFVLLLDEKVAQNKLQSHDDLSIAEIKEVIIESGKSRLRPVLLTALTAVLGLIPLAIGLNFDFFGLITDLNPHLYMGGDNVIFWSPLAWTIIFGLTYATVLTLVMVPVMFYLVKRIKYRLRDGKQNTVEI
jgi:multidrug efflux pump subunit AcrB